MIRIALQILVLGIVLISLPKVSAAESSKEQTEAIAKVKALGGILIVEKNFVTEVTLVYIKVNDNVIECLEKFSHLRKLTISLIDIKDAGIEHLSNLSQLEDLNLEYVEVTDTEMKYLNGLSQLQHLVINSNQVTDAKTGIAAWHYSPLSLPISGASLAVLSKVQLWRSLVEAFYERICRFFTVDRVFLCWINSVG
jgi:hypothetical protein